MACWKRIRRMRAVRGSCLPCVGELGGDDGVDEEADFVGGDADGASLALPLKASGKWLLCFVEVSL